VVLAGGDGTRLRSLTRMITGDERPKQFCAVLGDKTLLDQTRSRVALAVRPEQTIFVLTRTHERFYDPLLSDVPGERLVVQPKNAGTAPAILYSLTRLSKAAPSSIVAFFPSDHYFSDDAAFMSYVESAFEAARTRDDAVILLGIKPDGPEVGYGWIESASKDSSENRGALRRVLRFWEKPAAEITRGLMGRGCLWNSFVMVGRVSAFLEMCHRASPALYSHFNDLTWALNTTDEAEMMEGLYSQLEDINFSQEILAARPGDLVVLPVGGLRWSDLGEPQRVLSTMADIGLGPVAERFWSAAAASKVAPR
jgi:mannose-1-phosphate guanylyltransferase